MYTFLALYQVEMQQKEKENKKPRRKIEWWATDLSYRKSNFTGNLSHIDFEPNPGIFRGEPLRTLHILKHSNSLPQLQSGCIIQFCVIQLIAMK